jgi:hypothetical protein
MYLITKILLTFGASKIFVMRRMLLLVFLTSLIGCKENEAPGYFTTEKASEYFKSIEDLCWKDNGGLWGRNLYGPIMFVERSSRRIISNFPDAEGHLKGHDGIYTGIYPNELIIYNEPVVFGGTTFAMVPVPPEENEMWIKAMSIHALFHCFQKEKGLENMAMYRGNSTRRMQGSGSNLNGRLSGRLLQVMGMKGRGLSGTLLSSGTPIANYSASTRMSFIMRPEKVSLLLPI